MYSQLTMSKVSLVSIPIFESTSYILFKCYKEVKLLLIAHCLPTIIKCYKEVKLVEIYELTSYIIIKCHIEVKLL